MDQSHSIHQFNIELTGAIVTMNIISRIKYATKIVLAFNALLIAVTNTAKLTISATRAIRIWWRNGKKKGGLEKGRVEGEGEGEGGLGESSGVN